MNSLVPPRLASCLPARRGHALARCGGSLFAALVVAGSLAAQTPSLVPARLDTRRAQATRTELEASLAQIDTILASPGFSSRIREAKRREAMLIRERLTDGDLQVGDQLIITVQNETAFSGTFIIGAGRVLSLPGTADIPLRGILRSEAQDYLTEQLRRYVRDPSVRVQTLIRMTILGAVGKQGFYQVPADVQVSDAIMLAGGPQGTADPNRTVVRRAGTVILPQDEIAAAIIDGRTLDQLNLRAGDEIRVDEKQVTRRNTLSILGVFSLATSVVYFLTRIF